MGFPLDETMIQTIKSAARKLRGADRRAFQAEATRDYCKGSSRVAERKFGWGRNAVQRGLEELASGKVIPDAPKTGCHGFFERLENLQTDIRSLVDPNSQTHPTFETSFRYTRVTGKAVREALVKEKGYKLEELPAESTMRALLNKMGYRLRRVQKTKPQKKFPKQMRSSRMSTPLTNEATKTTKRYESR
jgi:Rhodopirellula transposase.